MKIFINLLSIWNYSFGKLDWNTLKCCSIAFIVKDHSQVINNWQIKVCANLNRERKVDFEKVEVEQ